MTPNNLRCLSLTLRLCAILSFALAAKAQTPIICGQSVANTTTATNQVDHYSYAGTAGQTLSIALWGPIGCPYDTMVAEVYNPTGQLVASLIPPCNTGAALNLTLTNTGIYTIVVHEYL